MAGKSHFNCCTGKTTIADIMRSIYQASDNEVANEIGRFLFEQEVDWRRGTELVVVQSEYLASKKRRSKVPRSFTHENEPITGPGATKSYDLLKIFHQPDTTDNGGWRNSL